VGHSAFKLVGPFFISFIGLIKCHYGARVEAYFKTSSQHREASRSYSSVQTVSEIVNRSTLTITSSWSVQPTLHVSISNVLETTMLST
jgi:hypothetical protein